MILKVQNSPQSNIIDRGTYNAKFVGVQSVTTVYGEAYKLSFTITDKGQYIDRRITGVCGSELYPGSKLFRWLSAIECDDFDPEEEVDIEQLIGMECKIIVEHIERDGRIFANVVGVDNAPF